MYKAPKRRRINDRPLKDSDFLWFCMEHIREYNKKWDFFAGMSLEEIAQFQKDAVIGHRPTNQWDLKGNTQNILNWNNQIEDFISEFFGDEKPQIVTRPSLPEKIKDALGILGLSFPLTAAIIKKRYKTLVKQYHPDVNKGCKASEEKFKEVSEAYRTLVEFDSIRV